MSRHNKWEDSTDSRAVTATEFGVSKYAFETPVFRPSPGLAGTSEGVGISWDHDDRRVLVAVVTLGSLLATDIIGHGSAYVLHLAHRRETVYLSVRSPVSNRR